MQGAACESPEGVLRVWVAVAALVGRWRHWWEWLVRWLLSLQQWLMRWPVVGSLEWHRLMWGRLEGQKWMA